MNYQEYKRALARSTKKLIVVSSVISAVIALLNFVVPVILSIFVDTYEVDTKIVPFLLVLLLFYVVSYSARLILNAIFKKCAIQFKTKQHMKLLEFMFRMSYEKLNCQEPTYLVERIAVSANTLYDVYAESVSKLVVAVLSITAALVITVKISPVVTLLLVLLLIIQVFGYKKLNYSLQEKSKVLQINAANNFKNILSITSKVDYIKQEESYHGILKILYPYVQNIHKDNAGVTKYAKDISTSLSMLITILQNMIYIFSAIMLALGEIEPSAFILVSMISSLYISGLSEWVNVTINRRDIKGVNEFIETELMANMEPEGGSVPERIEQIDFRVSNMGYGDNILLEEGSFSARPGEVIMLDGASGTGKSTLMKGLLKFAEVHSIFINGTELQEIDTRKLRGKIQFFSQNVPIITGTIRENIAMGKEIDLKSWKEIEKKSFLKKFYEMPEGLDTVVLENGSNLSGGDKQKLALARLYLEAPDVIILDESTNSIDEEGALDIIRNVIREFHDKIIFLISHNSQTKELCTKYVSIQEKRLVVEKTHV